MRLVIRLTGDWLTAWQRYSERRQLRRESSTFAIRRWFCQQPVIPPMASTPSHPSTLRLVRGDSVLMSSPLRTTPCGLSDHGDSSGYTEKGILWEQEIRR